MKVEDLSIGDKVQIYDNPDKETLRTVVESEYPELVKRANEYSKLWQKCLREYYWTNFITEKELYELLVKNGFSVSINTLKRYLHKKEVMFPARNIDLIAIAKTVDDERMNYNLLKNKILPTIHDFDGKRIKEGFKFSDGINYFLITGEINEYLSKWYSKEELEKIVDQISSKTIKDIELLITKNNTDD